MTMTNIKNIRLLSGEELVAEVTDEVTHFVLKNPVAIVAQQEAPTVENPAPKPKLGFAPWAMLVDQETKRKGVSISKTIVVYCEQVNPELEAGYRQLFGKIMLPGSGQRLFKPE